MSYRGEMEQRTKRFALRVLRFVTTFPPNRAADVVGYQLAKASTSVGANYREAARAESHADFMHKMAIVEKEASETQYWLELCVETPIGDPNEAKALHAEATELLASVTSSNKTAKSRGKQPVRDSSLHSE